MKVTIIGASGKTGTRLVGESLRRGYRAVAVCRDSSVHTLDPFAGRDGCTVTTAPGVFDQATLAQALADCDAVNRALAPTLSKREGKWQSDKFCYSGIPSCTR